MRILLLGGSKSGKSMLGQRLTRQLADGGPMIYWATLEPRDTEDRAIVRRHLAERDGWGFETLERGIFADIKRPRDGGKGLDGVVSKAPGYFNPFLAPMMKGGAGK